MAVEFFTKEGKGFSPKASIRKPGQIGLNQGSIERYKFRNGEYVLLGYDKERKMIAIKRIDEPQKGAKKISIKANNGAISAKSFLDYFDIKYDKTEAYELQEDKNDNMLVFLIGETEK